MSRDLGARAIFHKPLEGFRWPTMTILPFFTIFTWYLVNIATQSSSHSCPVEIREQDLRWPTCYFWESLVERGIVVRVEGSMLALFATCTEGLSMSAGRLCNIA